MNTRMNILVLAGIAIASVPAIAMSDLSEDDSKTITDMCKSAIAERGYANFEYKYIDTLRSQSLSYSMSGQLHNHKQRYEFNCVLSTDMKTLKIETLVINALAP